MTRDELAALERALQEAEPPDAGPARERARRTVLAAHAQARPRGRVRRAAPLVWAALAATLAAVVITQRDSGPAQAVERLVRDIVQVPAKPAPTPVADLELPAGGRLLVSDADGLYVVARDGRRTRLGRYDDASWSPNGLYVAASSERTLAALDPRTRSVRWTLRPGGQVSVPRWSPGALHIAYRSGDALRIVWGNGRHDVLAGRDMAPVAPAWRPGTKRAVAWAANDGTVTLEDADTAKELWTPHGRACPPPRLVRRRPPAADRRPPPRRDPRPLHRPQDQARPPGRRGTAGRGLQRQPPRARGPQRRRDRDPRPRRCPARLRPPRPARVVARRPLAAGRGRALADRPRLEPPADLLAHRRAPLRLRRPHPRLDPLNTDTFRPVNSPHFPHRAVARRRALNIKGQTLYVGRVVSAAR